MRNFSCPAGNISSQLVTEARFDLFYTFNTKRPSVSLGSFVKELTVSPYSRQPSTLSKYSIFPKFGFLFLLVLPILLLANIFSQEEVIHSHFT
jgi:hypothetical protein